MRSFVCFRNKSIQDALSLSLASTVQIPGVAINKSSAITGVDAVCSPPPQHLPFSLPGTYMHGKEAKAVADSKVLPGDNSGSAPVKDQKRKVKQ